MKSRPSRLRSGFTLIELLVVIAIIAILASLVLATAGYVQDKAGRSRAEAEIAAMSAALESYKIDFGAYPESTDTSDVIEALMPETAAGGKVYFEFPPRMLSGDNLIDPFGNPYNYAFPGNVNRSGANFFDLWSTGKNANNEDEAQWIKNW